MMNNQTIEKLNALKLFGMSAEFQRQLSLPSYSDLPFEQRVCSMVDHEITLRQNKRLQVLLKKAQLPENCSVEDIDYQTPRGLDKSAMLSLTKLDWVRSAQNLVLTGPTGTGKTWLASALANQACRMGMSCMYTKVFALMEIFLAARASGNFTQRLTQLRKLDLLIVDDWGLDTLSRRAQNDLLELIDSRLNTKSLIIMSQIPMNLWHNVLDNKTIADAVMDRIVHSSYYIQLSGESLRKMRKPVSKRTPKK